MFIFSLNVIRILQSKHVFSSVDLQAPHLRRPRCRWDKPVVWIADIERVGAARRKGCAPTAHALLYDLTPARAAPALCSAKVPWVLVLVFSVNIFIFSLNIIYLQCQTV